MAGVRRAVDAALGETVEFPGGLVVEVLPVDHEEDLADLREALDDLAGLERGERLARPGRVPDVRVFVAVLDPVDEALHRVELVRAEHLEDADLGNHDVVRDHLGDVAGLQERASELGQVGNPLVFGVGPVERLLERLVLVVREVLGVDAVADHEDLHVLEKAVAGVVRLVLVAVDLVERELEFGPAPLQLDLDEWQAVDQYRDVVPVFPFPLGADLVRDLELVHAPFVAVQEADVQGFPAVALQDELVPEDLRPFDDRARVQVAQDPLELLRRERHAAVVLLELAPEVREHGGFAVDRYALVLEALELLEEAFFQEVFGLGRHGRFFLLDEHIPEDTLLVPLRRFELGLGAGDLGVQGEEEAGDLGLFFGARISIQNASQTNSCWRRPRLKVRSSSIRDIAPAILASRADRKAAIFSCSSSAGRGIKMLRNCLA